MSFGDFHGTMKINTPFVQYGAMHNLSPHTVSERPQSDLGTVTYTKPGVRAAGREHTSPGDSLPQAVTLHTFV